MTPKPVAHTPTPWFYDDGGFAKGGTIQQSHDERTRGYIRRVEKDSIGYHRAVCRVVSLAGSTQQDLDAAYIVKCVNTHEELLAAAKYFRFLVDADLLDAMTRDSDPHGQAIAKAEGVEPKTKAEGK